MLLESRTVKRLPKLSLSNLLTVAYDRPTSPASAEYPDYFEDDGEVTVWRLANGDYRVYSQVDSENGFGASLRSFFVCTVDYTGGGNYQLVDLEIV